MSEFNRDDYPSNSHISKEEKKEDKKIEKVVSGNVIQKKKSFGKKMAGVFLEDDTKSVWQYLLYDVLIPAAKSTISDMVSSGVEMLLFGSTRGRPNKRNNDKTTGSLYYLNYSSCYDKPTRPNNINNLNRARMDFNDIILESRGEAEDVLTHLFDLVDRYGVASVADLYELVGIAGNFTDNKYGWTNLSSASVTRVRDGYLVNLPKPTPID